VHAYGALRLRDDPQFLRQHLEALVSRHESDRVRPWHVSDAPADFIAQQMKAIVGIELAIERLEGKWKMSQNRSAADIDGVIDALGSSKVVRDHAVADIVAERRPKAK
jgi:transcriptional regulator